VKNGAGAFGGGALRSEHFCVKRGFSGGCACGVSRFGKEHGWADESGGGGSEVKVPALRFAIGRGTRHFFRNWGASRPSPYFPQVSEAGPRALGMVADYILPAAFFATSRSLSSSVAAIAV